MAEFTGERVIPGQVDPDLWNEHFARYAFASRLARRRRVLDIGCGSGYGSAELARVAASVTGLDVSGDAAALARSICPAARFLQASGADVPFRDASFDLVAAFEVIEHIPDWPRLLAEARRLLAPGGQFILSTPNKSYYAESRKRTGPNPFHVHEFEFEEFRQALGEVFPHVSLFVQNHTAGIVFEPLNRAPASEVRIDGGVPDASSSHFYIAVCALTPQTGSPTFIYLPSSANVLRERELHIERLEAELATKNQWLDEAREEHRKLVDQFRAQTAELEQSNRWAESLNEELRAYAVRTTELEAEAARLAEWAGRTSAELEAKVAELAQCVEYLHAAEREVEARTKWALGLEAELKTFQAKLEESRWMRLGRTLGMGPVVGRQ